MTPLELANKVLSELIEENKDNESLCDKLMIAYTGYQAATNESILSVGCNGVPMPTSKPTPNGSWSCTSNGWVWVDET